MRLIASFVCLVALGLSACFAPDAAATTVTAADISSAASSPGTGDLGDNSVSVGALTASASPRNLGWEAGDGGFVPDTIGVAGGGKDGRVSDGELLTLDFSGGAEVSQLSFGRHGGNDIRVDITGFSSDPGASFDPVDPAETDVFEVSYDGGTGTLSVASKAGGVSGGASLGFVSWYNVDLANTVAVNSLEITSPTTNGGSGGVGLASVTFTIIPEPTSLVLGAIAMVMASTVLPRGRATA